MEAKRNEAREVIAKVSGVEAASLTPEMDLVADLAIDSPRALQLLVALEERLEIEISDEEAARLETVGDILDFVEVRAAATAATAGG